MDGANLKSPQEPRISTSIQPAHSDRLLVLL